MFVAVGNPGHCQSSHSTIAQPRQDADSAALRKDGITSAEYIPTIIPPINSLPGIISDNITAPRHHMAFLITKQTIVATVFASATPGKHMHPYRGLGSWNLNWP